MIDVKNFRNFGHLRAILHSPITIVKASSGWGKTNFLAALRCAFDAVAVKELDRPYGIQPMRCEIQAICTVDGWPSASTSRRATFPSMRQSTNRIGMMFDQYIYADALNISCDYCRDPNVSRNARTLRATVSFRTWLDEQHVHTSRMFYEFMASVVGDISDDARFVSYVFYTLFQSHNMVSPELDEVETLLTTPTLLLVDDLERVCSTATLIKLCSLFPSLVVVATTTETPRGMSQYASANRLGSIVNVV